MLASMSLSSLGLMVARADEKSDRKSRQYKIGAGVLAGAALYYGVKKKNPIGAAAAGAGAYYAYKKSKDTKGQSRRDRYGYNTPYPSSGASADTYPDDNGGYANGYPATSPGGNGNSGYPVGYGNGGYDNGNVEDNSYPRDVSGEDYGATTEGGEYAQNGEAYPDYGLNGLSARRSHRAKAQGSKQASQHRRRVATK